jgi:hypothetical protein
MVGRLRDGGPIYLESVRFGRAARQLYPHQQTFAARHSGRCWRRQIALYFLAIMGNWRIANRHAGPSDVKGWSMVCAPFRAVRNPYRHWLSPASPWPTEPAACFFVICLSSFASRDAQESPPAGLAFHLRLPGFRLHCRSSSIFFRGPVWAAKGSWGEPMRRLRRGLTAGRPVTHRETLICGGAGAAIWQAMR